MAKKLNTVKDAAPSTLEQELAPVLRDGDSLAYIRSLLAQLDTQEKRVIVISYPACNAGAYNAGVE